MKRFESKDRPPPAGTRSGPRARAAQDRKFGDVRAKSRDPSRADPYQRVDRPSRPPDRDPSAGEPLRAPSRSAGITLDADVARVFQDSEAVNEALRMVIRLARTVGSGARPAFNRSAPPDGVRPRPSSGPRTGAPSGPRTSPRTGPRTGARSGAPSERYARDERPRERRPAGPPARREPKFEGSE